MTRKKFFKLCSTVGLGVFFSPLINAKEKPMSILKKLPKENMYSSNLGWLESRFHFSFADYYKHDNMNFGVLRVLNDDIIHPEGGFPTHPHKDMEIISYVIDGEITHQDSMGNEETLKRGEVQYMSAGTGIKHSEFNLHKSEDLRLLQMWIVPPKYGVTPLYGSHFYKEHERKDRLLNIVSSQEGEAKVKIYQDVNIYVCELTKNKTLKHSITNNRQIYFVQIEGSSIVNGEALTHGDALSIVDDRALKITALSQSHFLFIEMPNAFS
jgi:redox-sensitive bicupin YhaK (pirin superfamily)